MIYVTPTVRKHARHTWIPVMSTSRSASDFSGHTSWLVDQEGVVVCLDCGKVRDVGLDSES